MSDPITFTSTSARFALPMLFVGQAQKEVFVNEALSRIDGLLHLAIEGESETPPVSPVDGEAWLVGATPTGAWANHPGEIALRQNGNWLFAVPRDGMEIHDKAAGQIARFDGQWQRANAVTVPAGGATIDAEARTAIAGLTEALMAAGILPPA